MNEAEPPVIWNGKHFRAVNYRPAAPRMRRPIVLTMDNVSAMELRLFLAKAQNVLASDPVLREMKTALEYVLFQSEASVAAHRRMEASKGMTPDGGGANPPVPSVNPPKVPFAADAERGVRFPKTKEGQDG